MGATNFIDHRSFGGASPENLECELPVLPCEFVAEAGVLLFLYQLESHDLINVSGRIQNAVRPEREFPVPRFASEINALVHEQPADTVRACVGLDEQEPKLRNGGGVFDEKDGADPFSIDFSDPAAF